MLVQGLGCQAVNLSNVLAWRKQRGFQLSTGAFKTQDSFYRLRKL